MNAFAGGQRVRGTVRDIAYPFPAVHAEEAVCIYGAIVIRYWVAAAVRGYLHPAAHGEVVADIGILRRLHFAGA